MSWLYDDYDWGPWSEWGPWIPDCLDNFDGRETIFNDQEIYQPKRFRSRNCYKANSFGTTTADEVRDPWTARSGDRSFWIGPRFSRFCWTWSSPRFEKFSWSVDPWMKLHYRILMESVSLKTSSTLNMEHVLKITCPVGALWMIPTARLLPRYVVWKVPWIGLKITWRVYFASEGKCIFLEITRRPNWRKYPLLGNCDFWHTNNRILEWRFRRFRLEIFSSFIKSLFDCFCKCY